jgi:hypothetical protein
VPLSHLPEKLLHDLQRIAGEHTSLSRTDVESVFEFIRMLEAPGPHDQNVADFIRNHLLDIELRAQRGKKTS